MYKIQGARNRGQVIREEFRVSGFTFQVEHQTSNFKHQTLISLYTLHATLYTYNFQRTLYEN